MTTRGKSGITKPKAFTAAMDDDSEPVTVKEALVNSLWVQAMKKEIMALQGNGTWSLVPAPKDRKIIRCKWVYKIKRKSDGTVERFKARLVAQGNTEQEGIDYTETFSLVAKPVTIRVILCIALAKAWSVQQLDVNNAFLNGDLTEKVYMRQPPE